MKKFKKLILWCVFAILVVTATVNTYNWIVFNEQNIRISMPGNVYTNSDLYLSIGVESKGVQLEQKTKVKLLDADGKKVKGADVSYEDRNIKISVPDVEAGKYFVEAKVSTKKGKDIIKKEVYITNAKQEEVVITFDKGIYKPGDTVNYRALVITKDANTPLEKEANICIYDGNDNKVYNENVKTSEYGIVSGSFTLANEVNSGMYKLSVKTDRNETVKSFKVNPYVTPKYEVKIGLGKENYLVGDVATIKLDANYFFGEPVANAVFDLYINDQKRTTLTADSEGKAQYSYALTNDGVYSLKVEAKDSSNYFVEATKDFVVGSDIFEIDVFPEYGLLAAGRKNNVYVFTSKPDGTPLKTYITVSATNFTKQIVTDENGIGKFSIDVGTITSQESYKNTAKKVFSITAENMSGEKVTKQESVKVDIKNILVNTDKIKYTQGEDINIKVYSTTETEKNIYLFKNNKLLKMITTDSESTSINLGETYGLIDIFVTDAKEKYYLNVSYNDFWHDRYSDTKTIFVKPSSELKIGINTDKQEYVPGENITIGFETKDENNKNIESALLVSMLDNAILSLANNDLSIDNIRLALSDLKFTDDLDAATLYSCIIDDKSEQTMAALLLKQGSRDTDIEQTYEYTDEAEFKAAVIAILSIVAIGIMIFMYLCSKFKKVASIARHFLTATVYIGTILMFAAVIVEEFFYREIDIDVWKVLFVVVVALASYIAWISKYIHKTEKTTMAFEFGIIILFLLNVFAYSINEEAVLLTVGILILVIAVFSKVNENKKLKIDKLIRRIVSALKYFVKFVAAFVISLLAANIIADQMDIWALAVPLSIIGTYAIMCYFDKSDEKDDLQESTENTETKKKNGAFKFILEIIGIIAVIGYIFNGLIYDIGGSIEQGVLDYGTTSGQSMSGIPITNTGLSNVGSSSIMDGFFSDAIKGESVVENDKVSVLENTENVEMSVDDNVRKVFLESMCFVPELITQNGTAELDLKLSDNITTWTIQTVGNTKDGRIGYASIDDVRVFKEFFVDFELPKNLVDTDYVSIPVTVYNYTEDTLNVTLKIEADDWFELKCENNITINVDSEGTKMIYVPILITKHGDYKFRVEATNNDLTDIVEKTLTISPKGHKVEKVVSTGILDEDISEDILVLEDIIENTAAAKVKIYASTMSQNIEGLENIFRMPTGCFEQVSSSLYPNIVALKYMEENKIIDNELKEKVLGYISSGYQKLLTYEVLGERGGYSLYGDRPAETVLTAYGLMEFTDLKDVYNVDKKVIEDMNEFLYGKQKSNGSFEITGYHKGGASSSDDFALNAYIIWALSESDPKNTELTKSIEYLKDNLDKAKDNYTRALIAIALANVEDKTAKDVVSDLINNININGNTAYLSSNIRDYYGSYGNSQTIQTVALTSMALSKMSDHRDTNKLLINYLVSAKDSWGTWYSTQATVLALKAINTFNQKEQLENQTIIVSVNSEEQKLEIKDNPLEIYEFTFDNLKKENKLNIDIEKGSAYYEVVEEYYIPYENVKNSNEKINIVVDAKTDLKVNELLNAIVRITNNSKDDIYNGMVTITIPQGFVVEEESLSKLTTKGLIEKYEMNYNSINLYLRDFETNQKIDLSVSFRASYPVNITGLAVRAYDYYNPEVEGFAKPQEIAVMN